LIHDSWFIINIIRLRKVFRKTGNILDQRDASGGGQGKVVFLKLISGTVTPDSVYHFLTDSTIFIKYDFACPPVHLVIRVGEPREG